MAETPMAGGAAPPEMGTGARLANVFFAPAKAFESIARKPGWDWLVPVALMIALALVSAFVVAPKFDVDAAVKQQMDKLESRLGSRATEEQKQEIADGIRRRMESMTHGGGRFITPLFILVPLFLVPAIYHGLAAMWGTKTAYLKVLAGYAWVQMVQVVKWVLAILLSLPKERIDLTEANRLVRSSVGAFLDPQSTHAALLAVANSVDLFELWAVALGSIALARTTRFTPKGAAATVIGLWLVWVLIQAFLALLGAAFGG